MAIGKQNLEAQYAKALSIGKTPQGFNLLKQAALGQSDDFDQVVANMALKALTKEKTAMQGLQAQQQLAQGGKQTVRDKILAQADAELPEMLGIGRLPAQNMDEMAAAQGGVVGYADGGEVARFDAGGSAFSRWWERVNAGSPEYVQRENERASLGPTGGFLGLFANQSDEEYEAAKKKRNALAGITTPPAAVPAVAPAATPAAAPAANAAANVLNDAPKKLKKDAIDLTQPKVPVADPTKQQTENVEDQIGKLDKWTTYLDKKYGSLMDPIKAQLEKDRAEYANMKSENVGLALLGAAGALLKPGRTTASAIGEGLSTLGEYGMRFQPQLLAARQGISSGEIGLAQAQAQAARGNFSTAAQLEGQREQAAIEREKLAMQRPYYAAYANYLSSKGAGIGGGGDLSTVKAYQKSLQDDIKNMGVPTSAADKVRLGQLQSELRSVEELLRSRVKGLNIGDNAAPPPGSIAGSYQRP